MMNREISQFDATATYRGYRLQALYVLSRILSDQQTTVPLEYQPEGVEDLAVYGEDHALLEIVQVKAYSKGLTLSDLVPEEPASFLRRILQKIQENEKTRVQLVSFSQMGPELRGAWDGQENYRKSIITKLLDYGYSLSDIDILFKRVSLYVVDEDDLRQQVFSRLRESLSAIDPYISFDLLNYWVYVCSENKTAITAQLLMNRIVGIGKFLSERTAYHQEWFTSIVPIEDIQDEELEREQLAAEFFAGVSARYEHIFANLDVVRHDKLEEVYKALSQNRIAVIHGASGQGKTTLAYRYLHDFFPDKWRFAVKLVQDRRHALNIARALNGHARSLGVPMAVYVDVSPKDEDWPELVRNLSDNQNLQILVTIREEDWRRSGLFGHELSFSSIELSFDEHEARNIYQKLSERKPIDRFINFDDAWEKFGGAGPLLEFVYLVTQGGKLRDRLQQQVNRLQGEARQGIEPRQIDLLRLTSIASSYGARLKAEKLINSLGLNNPQETLRLLEKEYLIKRTEGGSFIEGLHPIRSGILSEILTDEALYPWSESARQCLSLMEETDMESFLLYSFSRRSRMDIDVLRDHLCNWQPLTWTGIAGVARALLWLGIRDYVAENTSSIRDLYKDSGSGWIWVFGLDVADAMPGEDLLSDLGSIISDERKKEIASLRSRQTDKKRIYMYIREWLLRINEKPHDPDRNSDWEGFAETAFWSGELSVNNNIPSWANDIDLSQAMDGLSINVLADLVIGLYNCRIKAFDRWLDKNRPRIIDRFREETRTVIVEDDEVVTAHFIVPLDQEENESIQTGNFIHDVTMERVNLLRRFFPDRQAYASHGYGHQYGQMKIPYDDTLKDIPKANLPLPWLTSINARFRNLANMIFRLETWEDYAGQIYQLRQAILGSLEQLKQGLIVHFRKQNPVKLFGSWVNQDKWFQCHQVLLNPPLLPRCAIDELGFVDETSSATEEVIRKAVHVIKRKSLPLQKYSSYLRSVKEFIWSLGIFFEQCSHVAIYNSTLAKANLSELRKKEIHEKFVEAGFNTNLPRLSTHNLLDALKALRTFQTEFRLLFSHFFPENELSKLEQSETRLLPEIWCLWYYYAFHAERVWPNAKQEAKDQLRNEVKKIRKKVERAFRNSMDVIKADVLSEDTTWDEERGLWITFDVDRASDLYGVFERVINRLEEAIGEAEYPYPKRAALELYWPQFIIVPLVRGKCIMPRVWKIPLHVALGDRIQESEDWWNYVMHPIPEGAQSSLRLDDWKNPNIERANRLLTYFAFLSVLTSHIADLSRIPEADDISVNIMQNYLEDQEQLIGEKLQGVIDEATFVSARFKELSEEEREHHSDLVEAMKLLIQLNERGLFTPSSESGNGYSISLNDMPKWAEQLQDMVMNIEMIRLHCIDDILKFEFTDKK